MNLPEHTGRIRIGDALVDPKALDDFLDDKVEKTNKRYRAAQLFATLTAAAAMVVAVIVLIGIAQDNQRNGQLLIDCTQPGGDCYEKGQERTGEVIQLLLDEIHADLERELEQLENRLAKGGF